MKQKDYLDMICDEVIKEAKADFNREWWRYARWVLPIGLILAFGPIVYALLK